MPEKIELPDYLKDITDDSAKDMVSSGGGAPRISIRGRQFRKIVDGEEISKQTEPMNVIIIGVVPEALLAHTYYIEGYQPGSSDPPDCSSFFGEIPDTWCTSPQSKFCRDCPHQVWGSATSMAGKKAKACKDSKRLLVIDAKDAKEDDPIVYLFNVTIASLKALSTYGKFLLSNNLPFAPAITEIRFVDSEFPQVEFNFKAVLSAEIGTKMLEASAAKPWMDDKPHAIGGSAPAQKIAVPAPPNDVPPPTDSDAPVNTAELLDKW